MLLLPVFRATIQNFSVYMLQIHFLSASYLWAMCLSLNWLCISVWWWQINTVFISMHLSTSSTVALCNLYTNEPLHIVFHPDLGQVEFCATQPLHDSLLSAALQQQTSGPNRILATRGSYATVALGLPDLVGLFGCWREKDCFFTLTAKNVFVCNLYCWL